MRKLVEYFSKYWLAHWLFIAFFFIHGFSIYLDWLKTPSVAIYFIAAMIITGICQIVLTRFLHSSIKASVALCLAIWLVMYFNFNHSVFIKITHIRFSSVYMLGIIALIFWISVIYIKKKQEAQLQKIASYLNLLFLILILVDTGKIVYMEITRKPPISYAKGNEVSIKHKIPQDSLPDIYLIVLDEHMSTEGMKDHFQFDNTKLDSFLTDEGFYIANNSKSNYSQTVFSIASALQMNYFHALTKVTFPDDNPLGIAAMKNNTLITILEKYGYNIRNYSLFDFTNHPTKHFKFFEHSAFHFYFSQSLINQINIAYETLNSQRHAKQLYQLIDDALTPANKETQPRFTYLHLVLPHHPFVFREDGSIRPAKLYHSKKDPDYVKNYLQQVAYTRQVIRDMVTTINKSNRKKIVVLEGDHGLRLPKFNRGNWYEAYQKAGGPYKNLNAYYFYDKNYTQLYDSISPVNSFRVISNQYLGATCKLLPDTQLF
ncbi:MAG: hypothetical protein ACK461_03240 [Bacteroidota bacterium]